MWDGDSYQVEEKWTPSKEAAEFGKDASPFTYIVGEFAKRGFQTLLVRGDNGVSRLAIKSWYNL